MSLKKISKEFREKLLKRNLKTPPDLVAGITNLGLSIDQYLDTLGKDSIISDRTVRETGTLDEQPNKYVNKHLKKNRTDVRNLGDNLDNVGITDSLYASYMDSRGRPTQIHNYSVQDEGDVMTNSDDYLNANLSRNRRLRSGDPSESDSFVNGPNYDFQTLLAQLGSEAVINDYKVINQGSVSQDPFDTQGLERTLNITANKYVPRILNTYEATIKQLKNEAGVSPYVDLNTTNLIGYDPTEYDPYEIFNLNRTSIADILSGREKMLANDTVMANIAAHQLKFAIEARVQQKLLTESVGRVNLIDAAHNPATLARLIKDPRNNLIEKNNSITVGGGTITKAADFLGSLAGLQSPVSLIPDIREDLRVSCDVPTPETGQIRTASSRFIRDLTGRSLRGQRDAYHLKYTGAGQKNILYRNLGMNKYRPNYIPEYESGLVAGLDRVRDQISNISQWVGGSGSRPVQNYYLGNSENDPIFALQDEQGDRIRSNEYLTKIWIDKNQDINNGKSTDYDEPAVGSYNNLVGDLIWAVGDEQELQGRTFGEDITRKFSSSGELDFRECSILDKTSKLLAKGGSNQAISQVRTKFTDGDYTYAKGSAVKNVNQRLNSNQTGNVYEITDEFCRSWTKIKPHSKIGDLMRYRGLLRKERNSVVGDNGNFSIYPTALNVNDGYGKYDSERNPYVGQSTARKYMLSIENLAWKDSEMYMDLPDCERGPNGGRVMWFPPYDVNATETTTANWTSNNFLGRPEPVYTYNHTERGGSLSFKLVVDHPSIMNVLIRKELASYVDKEVDEIIDAFWSGCLEFDIYQLARIWGVFSISELEYFKEVIENINGDKPNDVIQGSEKVVKTVGRDTNVIIDTDTVDDDSITKAISELTTNYFYFENDMPMSGSTEDFNTLFEEYKTKAITKGEYSKTLGSAVPSEYSYFTVDSDSDNYKGFEPHYNQIKASLDALFTSSKGRSINIKLKAYTSSLAPTKYNEQLAIRRFKSVGRWIASEYGLDDQGAKLTDSTINTIFIDDDKIEFKKLGQNGKYDTVTLTSEVAKELSVSEMLSAVGATDTYDQVYYHSDNKVVTCTESDFESREPDKLVCSVYSIPASIARRVEITSIDYSDITKEDEDTELNTNTTLDEETTVRKRRYTNLTKRDIAQRLLSKLVTECSYFEYLESESPTVYASLKEKLKYFHPTFHSMTPEGLNARLTFLQQCLRSGETMKVKGASGTTNICDAPNTTFGKPPICVLRIGDFYNSRIIIDGLTIDFDGPMSFDLNPEGIGAQPMLANVTLTFKFLGGQGLRGPVKQLQNALSFNYYANTEIYDGRSYANTNEFERNLQQYEKDALTGELDLVSVVNAAAPIKGSDGTLSADTDTIGENVGVNEPIYASGRTYYESEYGDSAIITENINYKSVFDNLYNDYRDYIKNYMDQQILLSNYEPDFILNNLVFFNNNAGEMIKPANLTPPSDYDDLTTYYTNLSRQRSYYQSGVDTHEVLSSVTNGKLGAQQIRLNLMVQEGLDKLTSGAGEQTFPTNPLISSAPIPNYNGLFIPKPVNAEMVDTLIDNYKELFMKRVEYGLLTIIRSSDKTIANELHLKYDSLLSTHRNRFRTYISSKLDEYILEYKNNGFDAYTSYEEYKNVGNKLYNRVLYNADKVAVILSGVDSGLEGNTRIYYEVVPSGRTLSTPSSTLFGHKPYKEIEIIGNSPSNKSRVISVDDVNTVSFNDTDMFGNFSYFADQYLSGRSGLANGESLPEYVSLTDVWQSNGGAVSIPVDYEMDKVFEKLNYEFYTFTNNTIRTMNYDNSPIANRFSNLELVKQNTKIDFLDLSTLSLDKLSTQVSSVVHDKIIDIYFGSGNNFEYKINEYNEGSTGYYSKRGINVNELNNIFKVEYKINSELNKRKSAEFVGMSGSSIPNLVHYSATFTVAEEMIFMGFYKWLKPSIADDLKTIFNDIKITRQTSKNSAGSKLKLQRAANDFADGLVESIGRLESKVDDIIKRGNELNKTNLNTLVNNVKLDDTFKTVGDDDDYTLMMRRTNSPNEYGKVLYNSYRKLNAYWNQFPE